MIKSIDTVFKGYKFRSRLEARWALFFDLLNIKWEYESDGVVLSNNQWYLPDFKLTSTIQGHTKTCYVEIKPENIVHDDKFSVFENDVSQTDSYPSVSCYLLSGDPFSRLEQGLFLCPRCGMPSEPVDYSFNDPDGTMGHYACELCDCSGGLSGKKDENPSVQGVLCKGVSHKGVWICDLNDVYYQIKAAALVARQRRFDRGDQS